MRPNPQVRDVSLVGHIITKLKTVTRHVLVSFHMTYQMHELKKKHAALNKNDHIVKIFTQKYEQKNKKKAE